jgi:hypothetical protein
MRGLPSPGTCPQILSEALSPELTASIKNSCLAQSVARERREHGDDSVHTSNSVFRELGQQELLRLRPSVTQATYVADARYDKPDWGWTRKETHKARNAAFARGKLRP